jgi:FRG domain
VFRGQADNAWPLQTSLEQFVKPPFRRVEAEQLLYDQFVRSAGTVLPINRVLPEERAERLALMQHHSTPTRLSDWTYSPYVATYFAFSGVRDDNDGGESIVWSINVNWMIYAALKLLEMSPTDDQLLLSGEVLNRATSMSNRLVAPLIPMTNNDRLAIQQGLFVYPWDLDYTFSDNLSGMSGWENEIEKIVLPHSLRNEVLDELSLMNITEATLFPGLDGFARSLKYVLLLKQDLTLLGKGLRHHAPPTPLTPSEMKEVSDLALAGRLDPTLARHLIDLS